MESLATIDSQDTEKFYEVVRSFLEHGIVTEEPLAHTFSTSRSTIQHWQAGRHAPPPAMRQGVCAFLRRSLYDKCWSILVEHAGAREDGRQAFLQTALERDPHYQLTEYRFIGNLGFGGKFWRYDGRLYCTCYPEDENQERAAAIQQINQRLAAITPKFL